MLTSKLLASVSGPPPQPGVVWAASGSPTSSSIYAIDYSGAVLVLGAASKIFSSSDLGQTWTERASLSHTVSTIKYLNGQFLAATWNGEILTSPDGTVWTSRTVLTLRVNGFAYGLGLYVAVGYNGMVLSSPDAITWTPRSSGTTTHINHVAFGNGRFIAAGSYSASTTRARVSLNGITWSSLAGSMTSGTLWSVRYAGPAGFIITGDSVLYTSPDGVTWTTRGFGQTATAIFATAYNGSLYVAVGYTFSGSAGLVSTSPDGVIWTPRTVSSNILHDVVYATKFYAVSSTGQIRTS